MGIVEFNSVQTPGTMYLEVGSDPTYEGLADLPPTFSDAGHKSRVVTSLSDWTAICKPLGSHDPSSCLVIG